MVRSVLASTGWELPIAPPAHPAVVALAHAAQAARGRPEPHVAVAEEVAALPDLCGPGHAGDGLDPAAPAPYLTRSVARAMAALPPDADVSASARVIEWGAAERAVLAESRVWLAAGWPQMLAELRVCVVQVALLEGRVIDGFTDFTSHGAIFVDRVRLSPSRAGMPGPLRLAEALVHEGTHTRCNAAALSTPFLTPAADDAAPVPTPLRADPRPIVGAFQQAVVLARCSVLYQRLLDAGAPVTSVLAARRNRLTEGAWRALTTLREQPAVLTEQGMSVLEQCTALLPAQEGVRTAG